MAPLLSMAFWKPKSRPVFPPAAQLLMRLSLGAVRIPLPILSVNLTTSTCTGIQMNA